MPKKQVYSTITMRSDIGKIRAATLIGIIALFGIYAARGAGAQPLVGLYAGFSNAWTKTPASGMGYHRGWNVVANAGWNFDIPLEAAGTAPRTMFAFSLAPSLRTQYLNIGPSNWLSDGSRYRAWNALGFGPEVSAALLISESSAHVSHLVSLDAAFLANFCNYTNTTLYTAYTSWLIGLSYTARLGGLWSLVASVPVEFAGRADGQSIIVGISVGGRYALKK